MILAFDIGGTNLKWGISNGDISQISFFSEPLNKDNSIQQFFQIFNRLIQVNNFKSIGIGIPGIIDNNGKIVVLPNLKGWEDLNLLQEIKKLTDIPVYLDNDANIAALAELYEGNGKNLNNFVYVTLGTGIGGAIIINRSIFKGDSGSAGEIGHMIIDRNIINQPLPSFRWGIVEEYCGREQIIKLTKSKLKNYPISKINDLNDFDVKDIFSLVENNDDLSKEIIKEVAYNLSIAFISTINLLDIHTIIIGGGIANSNYLLEEISKNVKKRALPHIRENFKIINAKFQSNTGIIGGILAAKNLLNN